MGGAPPVSSPTPFLELTLYNGEGKSSLPISLEPVGTRPSPGTPETYSVEGSNIANITHIRLRLIGNAAVSWTINDVTIHSPTSGHTHYFPCKCDLVGGGEGSVVRVAEVLESSLNTSTRVSTPRPPSASELIGKMRT